MEIDCTLKYYNSSTSCIRSKNANPCLETGIGTNNKVASSEAMETSEDNPQLTNESENSSDTEDDVKVCDICGDEGQEELLAVCSKCADGAEHTYCMRIKLDKLPEGDWLCEECELKEKAGNQKEEKCENVSIALEVPCSNGNNQNVGKHSDLKLLHEINAEAINSEVRGTAEIPQSPQNSVKCQEENAEFNLPVSEKTSKMNGISIGTANPAKRSVLSRESSFSSQDMGRVEQPELAVLTGGQSLNNSEPFAHSQISSCPNSSNIQEQLQPPRGAPLQSNSFNSSIMKDKAKQLTGSIPYIQKNSEVFVSSDPRKEALVKKVVKSTSFKNLSSGYSKADSIINPPRAEDTKSVKQMKERNIIENRSSFKLDRPIVSPPVACIGNPLPKVDPKAYTHPDVKAKCPTFFSTSKQAVSADNRILHCQKCNEVGHPTHLCSVDKLSMFALKPSAERNLREGPNKSNKWKAAVDATVSKTRIQKSNRLPDRSVLSCQVPSKDFRKTSKDCLEGTTDAQENWRSPVADPNIAGSIIDENQQAAHQFEAYSAPRSSASNPIVTLPDMSKVKPFTQVMPNRASVLANLQRTSVIPEFEFIWRGGFEVQGSGRLPKFCDGVQAHLSTNASPKVLEVATKFPCKVQLEEVPSLSSWPMQGHSPEEHNIGLFFFAKDVESYERNYWKLMDNMLKNDLALKGQFDGVELIIFPSNKLPEHSQRWNSLFFLWGIFRGRRPTCLENFPNFQEKSCGSILNSEPLAPCLLDPMSEISTTQRTNADKEISTSDSAPRAEAVKSTICVDFQPISSSGTVGGIFHKQESPLLQESLCPAVVNDKLPSEQISCSLPEDAVGSKSRDKLGNKESLLEGEATLGNNPGGELTVERPNRKRPLSTSIERPPYAVNDSEKSSGDTMHNALSVAEEKEHKKLKLDNGGHVSLSSREENLSHEPSAGFHLSSSSFLNDGDENETMMPGSSKTGERYFTADLCSVRDIKSNKVMNVQPLLDESTQELCTPNLKLVLGGKEESTEEEILPVSFRNVSKKGNHDDPSASLSLSLTFPASEKEQESCVNGFRKT